MEALKVVDEALLGYEIFDMAPVIERVKPDIIAVGYDQEGIERMAREAIDEKGLSIEVKRISRFGQNDQEEDRRRSLLRLLSQPGTGGKTPRIIV